MNKTAITLLVTWNVLISAMLIYLLLKAPNQPPMPRATVGASDTAPGLVFVNTDTLLAHYPYYEELNDAFKKKQDSIEKILTGRAAAIERDVKRYQESAGGLTGEQRQIEEENLYGRQQELVEYRETLLNKLTTDESAMMDKLHNHLAARMKEFSEGRFRFIFGYQRNSGILFADDSLDVTQEVIRELKRNSEKRR